MNLAPAGYRDPATDRSYVCPGCGTAQRGPAPGGPVTCPQCRTPFALPDRSAILNNGGFVPMPVDDPARLQQLRMQDGRARVPTPSLLAVLGGPGIQPGREQEAMAIWQSLRARSSQNDVAASEDLATLTLLLTQHPGIEAQPGLVEALCESAYDACVLPRHKIEQLGRLARRAVRQGDRARAQRYLSWMMPNAPELEADSELRLSAAVLATADRDPQRVLALLGPRKDAIPIADQMDAMASVFRANAYEAMGNVGAAQQVLAGELPDPRMLEQIRGAWPTLQLCPQAAGGFTAQANQAAAQRASSSAGGVTKLFGIIFMGVGLMTLIIGIVVTVSVAGAVAAAGAGADGGGADVGSYVGGAVPGFLGLVFFVVGLVAFLRGRAAGQHAAWLRVNGVPMQARIAHAQPTGTRINNVPVYQFVLQVAGPQGPYQASFRKLVPEHQVAMLLGQTVRVRVNPQKPDDLVLEE